MHACALNSCYSKLIFSSKVAQMNLVTCTLLFILLLAHLPIYAKQVIIAKSHVDVETGKLVEQPAIGIVDGKIESIMSQDRLTITDDMDVIDLSEHTLLPGLMDMHVHLTSDANIHGYRRLTSSLPRTTLRGVSFAEKTLLAGFTTVRNVGAPGFADVALRDSINDGEIIGPRMYVAGRSIGVTGGHCDNNLLPYLYQAKGGGVADGPWKAREKVRENIKYGASVIKICATGGVLSKGTKVVAQQLTIQEIKAIVEEAHMRGLTVAAHAHGLDGIKAAIEGGVDSIEHASFADKEAIKMAKARGTYFSMDIYVTEYILGEGEKAGILEESLAKERLVGKTQRRNFKDAVDADVNMVFGSDAGVYPHGDNGKQFSRMVEYGMTPMQAIQSATINPATMLKVESELGSLSVGKLADIIAVKGNPLRDISLLENVHFVMKEGQVFKNGGSD